MNSLLSLCAFASAGEESSFRQVLPSPAEYMLVTDMTLNIDLWMPVKEIAVHCGFSSEFYFSRLFKEKTSIPPSAFCFPIYRSTMDAHYEECVAIGIELYLRGIIDGMRIHHPFVTQELPKKK